MVSLALLAARARINHSAAWTPASLFVGGFDGGWYDPSDLTTLFQDVLGTMPITATGQSVALIKDKSGNGHDFSEATSLSRPTYQVDGSSNAYLSFSGTNFMDAATGALSATTFGLVIGYNASAAGQRLVDTRGTGAGGTVKGWYVKSSNPSGNDGFVVDSGAAFISSNHTATASTNHVGYFDHVTSTAVRYAIDNGSLTSSSAGGGTVTDCTSTTITRIGAATNSSSTQPLTGRIYGIIQVKKTPSSTEITNMRHYMGGKTGVVTV